MLCGRFPFWGKTDIEYMRSLNKGPCMVGEGWNDVSEEGKQFVKELLHLDAKVRLTAEQALDHPWINTEDLSINRKLSSISGLAMMMKERKPPDETTNTDGDDIQQEPDNEKTDDVITNITTSSS